MNTFIHHDGRVIKYQPCLKLKFEKNFTTLNQTNIPKEIIFLILSFSNEHDLVNLSYVNHQFFYFSSHDTLWKIINENLSKTKIYWPISKRTSEEKWKSYYLKLSKIEKQVQNIWQNVELFLSTSASFSLKLPATKEDIKTLEDVFSIPLDIGFSLSIHNGSANSNEEVFGVLGEYKFSSIEEMIEDYEILKKKEIFDYLPLSDYFQSSKFYCCDTKGKIYLMDHGNEVNQMNN
eukprot:gene10722-3342_t